MGYIALLMTRPATTLKMMVGLLAPTSGTVEVMGQNMAGNASAIKRLIGYLPEESPLYENMTVREYLLFFSDLYGTPRKLAEKRIDSLLAALKLPDKHQFAGELSKGMRRKVTVARTLLHDPTLLVLDEPSSGLDPLTSFFIIDYLKRLNSEGKTIVLSAHNLYHIEYICHRVAILKNGELVMNDTMPAIRERLGNRRYEVVFKADAALDYEKQGDNYVFTSVDVGSIASLLRQIAEKGWILVDLSVRQSALEDIYVRLMDDSSGPE